MARKSKAPKPLVPHVEGEYLTEVVVVRIPVGTPPAEARKATEWARNMAKKISKEREHLYWMNERNGNGW